MNAPLVLAQPARSVQLYQSLSFGDYRFHHMCVGGWITGRGCDDDVFLQPGPRALVRPAAGDRGDHDPEAWRGHVLPRV
jgi:hypothetical protein